MLFELILRLNGITRYPFVFFKVINEDTHALSFVGNITLISSNGFENAGVIPCMEDGRVIDGICMA